RLWWSIIGRSTRQPLRRCLRNSRKSSPMKRCAAPCWTFSFVLLRHPETLALVLDPERDHLGDLDQSRRARANTEVDEHPARNLEGVVNPETSRHLCDRHPRFFHPLIERERFFDHRHCFTTSFSIGYSASISRFLFLRAPRIGP